MHFRTLNLFLLFIFQNFPGGASPRIPLQVSCAFGARPHRQKQNSTLMSTYDVTPHFCHTTIQYVCIQNYLLGNN